MVRNVTLATPIPVCCLLYLLLMHYCSKVCGSPRQFPVFQENSHFSSTVFIWANIIAQGFSNHQLTLQHNELNNVPLEHRSDGGWKWASVHLCRHPRNNLPLPPRIDIYHINNFQTVFLINLMLSSLKK